MIFGIFGGKSVADVQKAADKINLAHQKHGVRIERAKAYVDACHTAHHQEVALHTETFELAKTNALADRYAALNQIRAEIEQLSGLTA
jgi:hypothetical protein